MPSAREPLNPLSPVPSADLRALSRLCRSDHSGEARSALAEQLALLGLDRAAARQLRRALVELEGLNGAEAADDRRRQWLERWPADRFTRLALVERLLSREDVKAAIRCLEDGLQRDPDCSVLWHRMGRVLTQIGRYGDAINCLVRTAELAPANGECRTELGHLFRNVGYVEESIHWHGEALALQPDSLLLRLNHLFVLPMVAQSNEQIAWCRERCEQGLRLMDEEVRLLGPQDAAAAEKREVAAICCHPFYLLYHDRDDRDLMERYGRVIVHAMNARAAETEALPDEWPWSETLEAERQVGRLRIGFVSAFFYDHSNARAFEGLIRYLDRASFEAVLIHLASTPRDAVSRRLETWCERVVTLPASMAEAQLVLSKLALDLLFFTDVGMHPSITKLASCRSAPVQATGWGVPQTSGMPDIDYYVSGDLVEPLQAESHYTETLVRLPGLPCCYLSESLELHERSRDYFVLPPDVPLWGCPQRLDKFHPDFDRALEAIARQVPESLFVFVEESVPSLTSFFLDRLAVSAPAARERVLMLGRMVRQDYLALAGCMDVLLDPFHFGSGITLYETIHTGTPVVTLEGRFLRSRFVAAAYRLVEVEDPPVAATPEAYVELAVALMKDPQRRKLLRQEIAAKAKARLYDRLDYVRGFEAFAIEAVAKARRSESQAG